MGLARGQVHEEMSCSWHAGDEEEALQEER